MALVTGWFKRSGQITDDDGRQLVVEGGGIGDSKQVSGSVAAPGAGAALGSLGSLVVGGVYRVTGSVTLTATAETQLTNVRLQTAGAVSVPGGGVLPSLTGLVVPFLYPRVTCGSDGIIRLAAANAATAGSIYNVSLTVTRVE